MIIAIADTHTAIWYLFSDARLREKAGALMEAARDNGDHIGVSAISLAEMVYLTEKGRIPSHALPDLHAAMADPKAVLRHVPLDETIAMRMAEISRQDVPDLPDRIIAATGIVYCVPILSRDGKIQSSKLQTIW